MKEEKYTKVLESAMETQDKYIKLLEFTIENLKKQLMESDTKIKALESQIKLQGEKKEKEKEKLKLKPKKRRMKMDYAKFIEKNLLNREKFSLKEIQDEFKLSRYTTYYLAGILKKDGRFETSKENKLLVFKRK
jgi:hypothetical protein